MAGQSAHQAGNLGQSRLVEAGALDLVATRAKEQLALHESKRRLLSKRDLPVAKEQAIALAVDGILGAAYRWWPDVILCTSAFFIPPWLLEVLRGRGHTIVTILADYGTRYQSKLFNPAFLRGKNLPVPAWLDGK